MSQTNEMGINPSSALTLDSISYTDLAYLSLHKRDLALNEIRNSLARIAEAIKRMPARESS
jgi:hypothetical protein